MERVRANFVRGSVSNSPLADSDTTLLSDGLISLPEITVDEQYAVIVLDPRAIYGDPEIVYVVDHADGDDEAEILRGQEGTTAREHVAGTKWVHAATADDFDFIFSANGYIVQAIELVETGNITNTAAGSWVAVDATKLPWSDQVYLKVGDVVRCMMGGQAYNNGGGELRLDFAVDQPTSSDTQIGSANSRGLTRVSGGSRQTPTWVGIFTATEEGYHRFRPIWNCDGSIGDAVLANSATSDGIDNNAIFYTVEKLIREIDISSEPKWIKIIDEDGSSLTNWTAISGTWGVVSDEIVCSTSSGDQWLRHNNEFNNLHEFVIEFDVYAGTIGEYFMAGFVYRANTDVQHSIEMGLHDQNGSIILHGISIQGGPSVPGGLSSNTWYTVKVHYSGAMYKFFVNDVYCGTMSVGNWSGTQLAIRSFQSTSKWRNIKVWVPEGETLP